jgi:acyl-CoA thioesterase
MNDFDEINKLFIEISNTYFEKYLKPQIVHIELGKIELKMSVLAEHSNVVGRVHGGVFASFADIAMGVACWTHEKKAVTSDMNLTFIRNVPVVDEIFATATVISNGRRLMRTRCEIRGSDGKLLVSATGTYFVLSKTAKSIF